MKNRGEIIAVLLLLIFISFSFSAKFSGYNVLEDVNDEGIIVMFNNFDNINFQTTNFIYLDDEELKNISDMKLENNFGKIEFLENVNLIENIQDNFVDLDSTVKIESNRVKVNVLMYPQLNKKARIELNGLNFTNPRIVKNGFVCADSCKILEYKSGRIIFETEGLGVFSVEEAIGGASISGHAINLLPSLLLDKELIEVSTDKGESKVEKLKISNVGNSPLNLSLESTLKEVVVPEKLNLEVGETANLNINFLVDENSPEVYLGKLLIAGEDIDEVVYLVLEVRDIKNINNIETSVLTNGVGVGENVEVELKIDGSEFSSENISIQYSLKSFDGEVICSRTELVPVNEQMQFMRELEVSSKVTPGNYLIYFKIVDGEVSYFATEFLKILDKEELRTFFAIFLISIFVILIFFVLFLERFRKPEEDEVSKEAKEEFKKKLEEELKEASKVKRKK